MCTVNWVEHNKTLSEQGIVESEVVLLKRKYFSHNVADIDTTDPIQLNLLYEQAKEDILNDTHPVPQDAAIQLAAHQMQIALGNFKEQIHKPGTLEWVF